MTVLLRAIAEGTSHSLLRALKALGVINSVSYISRMFKQYAHATSRRPTVHKVWQWHLSTGFRDIGVSIGRMERKWKLAFRG